MRSVLRRIPGFYLSSPLFIGETMRAASLGCAGFGGSSRGKPGSWESAAVQLEALAWDGGSSNLSGFMLFALL
jgi:hypothetical protein